MLILLAHPKSFKRFLEK